ncbi:SpoIIIAH-like family protein [Eubacterium sp.]|uniref:SpoIIIAH-like family protein n=1 Tax=Eubacterium sp. TaxID=142586 RepID=UPI0035211F7B
MKKIFKKNQFIVTFLAVLIAVAGYLNYADNADKKKEAAKVNGTTYESVYDGDNLLTGDNDIESLDGEDANNKETKESAGEETTKEPGAAVLTNGTNLASYMAQARLNREQIRSKNKETLLEVINNNDISEGEKKKAVKSMVKLTELNEKENTIETLLKAKGFDDIVVTISDEQADVIISENEVDDAKRAQIEDVIKRKAGVSVDNITITPTGTK